MLSKPTRLRLMTIAMPIRKKKFPLLHFASKIMLCGCFLTSSITSYAYNFQFPNNDSDSPWKINHIAIHGDGTFGVSLPVPLHDLGKGGSVQDLQNRLLLMVGGKLDIGTLYVRRWILRHFDCYPQLGILLKYNRFFFNIEESAYIGGGMVYLEPNHDYTTRFEMLPRFGVGIAYLNIPGGFSSVYFYKLEADGTKTKTYLSASHLEAFRDGVDLNILLAMMLKFRITPHWHMALTLGLDYYPALFAKDEKWSRAQRAIEIYTVSLSGGYTLYPSDYIPPQRYSPYDDSKTLIDIAWLNSFRKAYLEVTNSSTSTTNTSQQANQKKPLKIYQPSDDYYYIGGLHIQWSCKVTNSHAFVLGSEWTKDWALKEELKKTMNTSSMQMSMMLGHEFVWGKLNFGQYVGVYLLNNTPEIEKPFIYNDLGYIRLGLNYRITPYLYVGTSLKIDVLPTPRNIQGSSLSNVREYTRINYLDFRIGYTF